MARPPGYHQSHGRKSNVQQTPVRIGRRGHRNHWEPRLSDLDYLRHPEELTDLARKRGASGGEPRLQGRETARAYRGLLQEGLGDLLQATPDLDARPIELALTFDDEVERLKIRDWHSNPGVRNRMIDVMDDHLYTLEQQTGQHIPHSVRDTLFDRLLSVARHRDGIR